MRGDRDRYLAGARLIWRGENSERLGIDGRVRFERGTVPDGRRFDLVLANLPYVREDEWQRLAPEITRYEPREALVAGADGVEAIASIARRPRGARRRAHRWRWRWARVRQAPVAELMVDLGFGQVEGRQDLAGIPRVVLGRQ